MRVLTEGVPGAWSICMHPCEDTASGGQRAWTFEWDIEFEDFSGFPKGRGMTGPRFQIAGTEIHAPGLRLEFI